MMNLNLMETMEVSDAGLVAECLTGDREAFGRIVARYQTLVCSLAYSRTGSLEQSEEVAQETFVAAWRQLGKLREPQKLRPWLCQITRNLAADALQKQGREPSHAAETLETAHELAASEPLPPEQAISNEEAAILWRALETLPEIYREPLVLFYRENESVEVVAQSLELSEDAVKQRLSRGRKLLQEQVLAVVEGALKKTSPGKTFAVSVLAALSLTATQAKAATAGTTAGTTMAKAGAAASTKAVAAATKTGTFLGAVGGWLPVLGSFFFVAKGLRQQLIENAANQASGPLTPEKCREIRAHRREHGSKALVYVYLSIALNMFGLAIMEGGRVWDGDREPRHLIFLNFLLMFSLYLFVRAWRSRPRC